MVVIIIFSAIIFIITLFYFLSQVRLKFKNKVKLFKYSIFNNRLNRIYSFDTLSENILKDILESIKDLNSTYEQTHALFPLLLDIRKYGDRLIEQRKFYHAILFSDTEQRLTNKIRRLRHAENFIKSLSGNQKPNQIVNFGDLRKQGSI